MGHGAGNSADLLADAARRAMHYLDGLDDRAVGPSERGVQRLTEIDQPLGPDPTLPERVIAELDDYISPTTMAMAGRRFFGFVIGGALPVTLAANWLAGAWDQNAALAKVSPGVAFVEDCALRWLVDLLGLPAATEGAFVTGATMANFTALAAARHHVLNRVGWPVEADGLFGAPPVTVVVGEEAHPTLMKSLGLLGFGRERVLRVPVDNQGRMRADRFPHLAAEPTIVCLQAGNLNTGAFDPFEEICLAARARGAWVHIDGAFGLWAKASPALARLAAGIELADSWATDAHKWLNVPYDSGLAFVKEPGTLPAAMAVSADYLPTNVPHRNPSDFTPELSRRARGIEVWAALRALGRNGLAAMFERSVRQAQRFAARLRIAGYEVLNEVELNQVLVSFGSPRVTLRTIDAIQRDGTCWCGSTVWQGRTAMRISVCSAATTDDDVERSADAMIRTAQATANAG